MSPEEGKKETEVTPTPESPQEIKTLEEGKVTTEEPKEEKPAVETPEGEVFDITDVEKAEDGKLIWKVDPQDPEGTVYVGKDFNELLKNIREGVQAKDSYIKKLKTEQSIKAEPAKVKKIQQDSEPADNMPKYSDILVSTATKYGVSQEMLQWGDEEWKQREEEKGSVAANREARAVEAILKEANMLYDQATVDYINDTTLDEETQQIRVLVAKYKLEDKFGEAQYMAVLKKVYDDKDNFTKRGVRKNGVIIREVVDALDELRTADITGKVSKKKDEEIAADRKVKAKLSAPPKTKTEPIPQTKAPMTIAQAAEEILKEYQT